MKNNIKLIAFDADDTLWDNEPYFREAEQEFCKLLEQYIPQEAVAEALFKTEMANLQLYGYGIKGFILSMIETISHIAADKAGMELVSASIALGKDLLQRPVVLLDDVADTLARLQGPYKLVVATKGDLLDQERKLAQSGLLPFFHHTEIMSNKKTADYRKLLQQLDCRPEQFLMIGNSIKSDILPVLELQAYAAHVPYHTTWAHEVHEEPVSHPNLISLNSLKDIFNYIS